MNKLKDGDKYLTIKILGNITLKAFKVHKEDRTKETYPAYKGEGVAVWINTYQSEFKKPEIEEVDEL